MKMYGLIPAALAALMFFSCGKKDDTPVVEEPENPKTEEPAPTSTDLKIMSFNIAVDNLAESKGWEWRRSAVNKMISDIKPTIIGFQEMQAHEMTGILNAHSEYSWYGVGRDSGNAPRRTSEYTAEETMTIFWQKDVLSDEGHGTFWLSETPESVSLGWDAACNRTVTWVKFKHIKTGMEFYMFNTHLDHKGSTARKESAKLIASKIKELNPDGLVTFLTGDFNVKPNNAALDPLNDSMKSARDYAAVSDNTKNTFHGFANSKEDV